MASQGITYQSKFSEVDNFLPHLNYLTPETEISFSNSLIYSLKNLQSLPVTKLQYKHTHKTQHLSPETL